MTSTRTISFKLYPTPAQRRRLEAKHALLKDLWNAALQERRDAWEKCGISISRSDQEKSLKLIRRDLEGWRGLVHTHEAQIVLKRLDLAFQSFFRRVKAGQSPGYPRFRSADRFPGWGYKEDGNGFRVELHAGWKHGFAQLFGIGRMRMRGVARTPGRVLTANVLRKQDDWYLSLVVDSDCTARAPAELPAIGVDWGVSRLLSIAHLDGRMEHVANPRHLDAARDELARDARRLSQLQRQRKISRGACKRQRKRLNRAFRKLAARRKDHAHKLSARLVRHQLIATESLTVRNMTRSARVSAEAPGRHVAQKSGLNRAILDTAPARLLNMIGYKAEEAGSDLMIASARKLKPSQRCPECGDIVPKQLSQRRHECACGCRMDRDDASALNCLLWAGDQLKLAGNSLPAGTVGGECELFT